MSAEGRCSRSPKVLQLVVCPDGRRSPWPDSLIKSRRGRRDSTPSGSDRPDRACRVGVSDRLSETSSVAPRARPRSTRTRRSLPRPAIGQNDVSATPLQMAMVAAGVANGGSIMVPHVMSEIRARDGDLVSSFDKGEWRRFVNPRTPRSSSGRCSEWSPTEPRRA